MSTSTPHAVSTVSLGVSMEEEHMAREALNRWDVEGGAFAADR